MSPEQVADTGVDQRADIYSFAVVLWELIAGRPMFEAETDVALFGKAMRGPTQRVSEFAPDIPPALDTAIWRALARDPRRRYPTARAFADALVDAYGAVDRGWVAEWMRERAGALLQERQETVRELLVLDRADPEEVDTITSLSQPVDVTSAPMMMDAPPARKRNYVQMGLLGFVAAGATVVVLFFATSNRAEPPPPPLTQPEPVAMPAPVPPPSASVATAAVVSSKVAPVVAPAPPPKPRGTTPKRAVEKDSKSDCNPPYTEDETGKHFKSWCLRP
jgi:serine/threonine-protein kinase